MSRRYHVRHSCAASRIRVIGAANEPAHHEFADFSDRSADSNVQPDRYERREHD